MTESRFVHPGYLSVLDRIHAIAAEGLRFAQNPYDTARYQALLELAVDDYAALLDLDADDLLQRFQKQVDVTTPKIGADAAVTDTQNRLLILQRTDDGTWCLPCGFVDIGENPAQAAVREVREETGLNVTPRCYIATAHKGPHIASHLRHQIALTTFMEPVAADSIVRISHEHHAHRWITADDAVDWHPGHDRLAEIIFAFLQSDRTQFIAID